MKHIFNEVAGLCLLLVAVPASSQEPNATSGRRFEVATIKPSRVDATAQDLRITLPPGRLEALNITLSELLQSFFGFSASGKVEGGPGWTRSERYDIVAKADSQISPAELGPMVMVLLKDRFRLVTHEDARESSGLALAIGTKPPEVQTAKEGEQTQITGDRRHLAFQNFNMPRLVNYLSQILRTPLEDHTGMKGGFDFAVDPDSFAIDPSATFADVLRSSIEHLGYIFEPNKLGVRVTVIDNAERPGEN